MPNESVRFLTVDEALAIHERLIEAFGGPAGVRDPGLLESALHRPRTGYYRDLSAMAAALHAVAAPQVVGEDLLHGHRGQGDEVSAAPGRRGVGPGEFEKRLVNQRRRLDRQRPRRSLETAACRGAELVVKLLLQHRPGICSGVAG